MCMEKRDLVEAATLANVPGALSIPVSIDITPAEIAGRWEAAYSYGGMQIQSDHTYPTRTEAFAAITAGLEELGIV